MMDFLPEEFEEIINIFREEGEEQVQKINQNLLRLEANPKDSGAIAELFREAHSIKGAARMIGLTDIQAVAHKLEDIFGLAKDEKLVITAQIIDILCKSVDCIASIIEEQAQCKDRIVTADISTTISQLQDIEMLVGHQKIEELPVEKPVVINESDLKSFKQVYEFSNTINPSIKACIESLSESSVNTDAIAELNKYFVSLDEEAQKLQDCKIKEIAHDLRIKLNGVINGSGILIPAEVQEIEEDFNNFIKNLEKNAPKFNNPEKTLIKDSNKDINSNITYINDNLMSLSNNSIDSLVIADAIAEKLEQIISLQIDNSIKKILEKILEIIHFSKESSVRPSIEIIEIIKQSFNTCTDMLLFPQNEMTEDPKMIVQRLEILLQMLKLSEPEQGTSLNDQTEDTDNLSKVDYSPVSQQTEILSKDNIESLNINENAKSTDSTIIKTLRVDTNKLDQLVSQVGELIISKIKAKDHLTEIGKISNSVEDWYREWNKAKQLIKYINRKPINTGDLPAGTSNYSQNKNIYSFFDESSSRFVGLMNQINTLYKTIQEDDARLNLIVNELEEKIKSVRVLPLATIFHMFPRMVRDIAREKNKDIELVISGSETSVDKKIIEEIKSPLMHIIRNSIDHGIEIPEIRIKNGKNPQGKIFLSAYHLENRVLIEVIDDGRGIDLEAIKRKAVQKGLLSEVELQSMNDDQIMNIIFWPGFSTGEVVTDISGRGIGLDIVHTKITQMNGKVNIKSTLGEGCKVSIQLPVTMATVKSFLVRVNNQTFAIPTIAIKSALLIKPEEIFFKEGKETIIVENKTIPVCKLSKILEMPEEKIKDAKIVVVIIQAEDVQVGFIIDKLLGDQEILHKNLTPPLLRVRNIAGVTTIGSGELCLIINVNDLVKSAYSSFGMTKKQLIIDKQSNTAIVKKNILVVDDSVTTRILERNILRSAGYNVTVAVNGLDALTKLISEKFDLVLSDIEMPEINGFELTERLRTDNRFKDIPIILVTSLVSEADKRKGLDLGANAYITKGGFNQEELINTIKKMLG
ncbi:MAG: hybrid sensor histidine kinase/response regulator [Candidatus Gastranaerophilales bacterium]|nr:hybrid sensor histidine kinase/response regulator [Candidatus Gastranaerophilales bacterium]